VLLAAINNNKDISLIRYQRQLLHTQTD